MCEAISSDDDVPLTKLAPKSAWKKAETPLAEKAVGLMAKHNAGLAKACSK